MTTRPLGGINFTASLLIISVAKIKEMIFGKKRKKPKKDNLFLSLVIIGIILLFLSFFVIKGLQAATPLKDSKCKIIYNEVTYRNIILRVDDIQANSWREIQSMIIEDANSRNITLVLGVIPNMDGKHKIKEDFEIYNLIDSNKCKMEIALHGYIHTEGEFSNLNFDDANEKIKKGKKIVERFGVPIKTFIPPNNNISSEASFAVKYNNLPIISAGYLSEKYGLTSSTFNSEDENTEEYIQVLSQCERTLDQNKTCIVVIHPQDYLTKGKLDKEKYSNYLNLIDGAKELNATIINFRDLYYHNEEIIVLN